MKEQFIKLTVYLMAAPEDIYLDLSHIQEILVAYAISIRAEFVTTGTIRGDHFEQYCDLCSIRNLTYHKAERFFNEVFEPVTDPREMDDLIPDENKQN